jgi:tRNA-(ms[2]io[6]A)-hydroxylase
LLHFEKVISLLEEKKIKYTPLSPSLYAQKLHKNITKNNDLSQLCDQLIIGAIIEARSCERFSLLATHLDDKVVARFYSSLIKSEARHFKEYLHLASIYGDDIQERVLFFLDIENKLIRQEESTFRIHSGKPILNNHSN